MGLDYFEELIFRMISICFFYMWPIPIKWDYTHSKLVLKKFSISWAPYCVAAVFVCLYGWLHIGTIFYLGYLRPHKDFTLVNASILLFSGAALVGWAILALACVLSRTALFTCTNETLEISDELDKEYKQKGNKWGMLQSIARGNALGAILVVPVLSLAPATISLAALYTDYDCINYILEEMLPDRRYRSARMIWFSILVRVVVNYSIIAEVFRSGMVFMGVSDVVISRFLKMYRTLIVNVKKSGYFCRYYTCLNVLAGKVIKVMHIFVYLIMTGAFWGSVLTTWTTIKCTVRDMTLAIYALFLVAQVGCMLFNVIVVPIICSALDIASIATKVHVLRAKLAYARNRTRINRMRLMMVIAIQPLRIKYGIFWYLGNDMIAECWWDLIVLRTFDAILIIDY